MARRATIPDDGVFEGRGCLYAGDAAVLPARSPDRSLGAAAHPSIDSAAALQALRVAAGAELSAVLAPAPALPAVPLVRPAPPVLRAPPAVRRSLSELRALCASLSEWLQCHRTPDERAAARDFVCLLRLLGTRDAVDAAARRADCLLCELDAWPSALALAAARCGALSAWDEAALARFAVDVQCAEETCARLRGLTSRYASVAPLVEAAAARAAAAAEVRQWAAPSVVAAVGALRDAAAACGDRVARDGQTVQENAEALMERIARIKKARQSADDA